MSLKTIWNGIALQNKMAINAYERNKQAITTSEIAITDLDLQSIENGIMATDLDLRVMEMEVIK